ncbi:MULTISPECIES: multidrug efflux SMR transporter [unclassified Actinomyces]|uniref:DMT family transporter n=1 Tax=unclassified Actinomyces TaxID=2609248 RepID=UPI002018096E|nr:MULTISPECIES: multidrug efflux SMR transporter [unclassified Actinomyces]MCL3777506.1 multidrug efflux SMR transporter [Actinomyces sp. AC-20-1]MCL3790094.1 multidrug efflux SMR transporter [Actinomyces sp. 187325]MCL3792379.1 multidrug efflux SMR transporter [Actinomyces sp. 186855]MCL3794115.1 multidrug efflux SMR transporter [Actinomyces sp. 217892]
MSWTVLILSGFLEAVWATAMDRSECFTRLVPTLVFAVSCVISMGGLAYALREVPVGTGYAVWTAIGAATTVTYAMVTGAESASVIKVLLLAGLIGCVVGLKVVSGEH